MSEIIIDVTDADVIGGNFGCQTMCPLARAIRRQLGLSEDCKKSLLVPVTMSKCRIFVADIFLTNCDFSEEIARLGADLNHRHLPGLAAAFSDSVDIFSYEAPKGLEVEVGHGILFSHDFCSYNTMSLVEIFNPITGEWE